MELTVVIQEGVTVIKVTGRFDAYSADQVATRLDEAAERPGARAVVDLAQVSFVDSTGLATLVRGVRRCRERGGDLLLCGLQQPVRIIFELTRLDRVFAMCASTEEAFAAFANR